MTGSERDVHGHAAPIGPGGARYATENDLQRQSVKKRESLHHKRDSEHHRDSHQHRERRKSKSDLGEAASGGRRSSSKTDLGEAGRRKRCLSKYMFVVKDCE